MTREDAERKIRSVFTNYFQFAGDREADEVIEALKQKPSYQLASHNDNDEAKSVLFDMLGKGMYVKNTKENQAILVALRALEQDTKEIYNKGFADGQKALAEHLKLCKEELLDKIKAEIDQKQYDFMSDGDYNEGVRFGLMLAYQIIDKCKAESEVQDADRR